MVVDAEGKIAPTLAAVASALLALTGHTRDTSTPAWEKLLQATQEVLEPLAVLSLQWWRAQAGSVSRLKTLRVREV